MCTKDIPRAFGGSAVIAVNHLGLGWNTPPSIKSQPGSARHEGPSPC